MAAVGPMTISSSPRCSRVSAAAISRAGGAPGRGRFISMTRTPKRCGRCASASVRPCSYGGTGTSRSEKSGGSST